MKELGPLTSLLFQEETKLKLLELHKIFQSLDVVVPENSAEQSQAAQAAEALKKKAIRQTRSTADSQYIKVIKKGKSDITATVRSNGYPKRLFSVFMDIIVTEESLFNQYMEENLGIKLYLHCSNPNDTEDEDEEEMEDEEDESKTPGEKLFHSKFDPNFYFTIEKQKTVFAVLDITKNPRFSWLPVLCREKFVKLAAIPNGDPRINDEGELIVEFQIIIHIEKKAISDRVEINLDDLDESLIKNPVVNAWQKLFAERFNKKRPAANQITPPASKRKKLNNEKEVTDDIDDEDDDDMDEYLVEDGEEMEDGEGKEEEIDVSELLSSLTATVDEMNDDMSEDMEDDEENVVDIQEFLRKINFERPKGLRKGYSLRPYQQQALKWMLRRELSGSLTAEARLHPQFKKMVFPDATEFYYSAQRGILTFEKVPAPPEPPGGILADEMGLGKTLETISVFLCNKCTTPVGGVDSDGRITAKTTLVVCPLTLLNQWKDEIEKFTQPPLSVMCFQGSRRETDPRSLTSFDVVITTYQTLAKEYSSHIEARSAIAMGRHTEDSLSPLYQIKYHRVCLDEAHVIKNRTSQQHKACCYIEADKRWALTGTPIQNHLDDIFALFSYLRMKPHGEWEWWMRNISRQYVHKNRIAVANLHNVMKNIMLRRTKKKEVDGKAILKLPTKFIHQKELTFSQAEQLFYQILEQASKDSYHEVQKSQGKATEQRDCMLELITIMRHLCCHPALLVKSYLNNQKKYLYDIFKTYYDLGPYIYEKILPMLPDIINKRSFDLMQELRNNWRGSTKIDALCDQILAIPEGTQAVVFSQWTSLMDIVEISFERNGIKYVRLDGSMNRTKRDNCIKRFKDDSSVKVGLISLKAGGVGLNLTWASYVFLIDPWWNPAVEAQAIDRVHRMGSKKDVHVIRFAIKGTIEQRILNLQRTKGEIANDILGDEQGEGTTANLLPTSKKRKDNLKEIGYLVGTEEYEFEEDSDHENENYSGSMW